MTEAAREARASSGAETNYVICATPRTGSYLLCEALRNSGLAGRPTEYLSGSYEAYWQPRWATVDYPSYLARVKEVGRGDNGVFGLKVHPVQLDYFCSRVGGGAFSPPDTKRKLLEESFPALRYVFLRRADKLRQGISYAKALQTRIWWDSETAPAPFDRPRPGAARFDRILLERSVTQMHLEEKRWTDYFEANGIQPLTLLYEEWSRDIDASVRLVLEAIGVPAPARLDLPPPTFRAQADNTTEEWTEKLLKASVTHPAIKLARRNEANARRTVARPNASAARTGRRPDAAAVPALQDVIANRQWWRVAEPFPHIRADNVFTAQFYDAVEAQYRTWRQEGRFGRDIPGYDVSASCVVGRDTGPLSIFCSRQWHDVLAGVLGIRASGEINVTLHHHEPGSRSGSPHNDLNPAFFAEEQRRDDGILVADPQQCNYRSGLAPAGTEVTERVRAGALIFYLGPARSPIGSGGGTGLYKAQSDPVDSPYSAVAPRPNSLVLFECTPFSFHSFITNPGRPRETLVMWIHRPRSEAVERWGEKSIVAW